MSPSLSIGEALASAVKAVAHDWKQAKRQADHEDRVRSQDLDRLRRVRVRTVSIKEAAYRVMAAAYRKASGGGRYPANARQIMYAARPEVLALTGGRCWKDSSYFTQHLLPNYIEEDAEAASWNVIYDARGHLQEPHTGHETPLGTLEVREYMRGWRRTVDDHGEELAIGHAVKTSGPANRYRFALFIEKEGFNPLLEQARIAARFDVALMSTKGMSVTAARELVERLSLAGVTILVVRDFDKAGFSIGHTLRTDTRRYRYRVTPNVVDLGLRLADIRAMGLQSEPVGYPSNVDPRIGLRECGATEEECDFLVTGQGYGWSGDRVELNAMTSDQLVSWLEQKLAEHGVEKLVPDAATLQQSYRRAVGLAAIQDAIDAAIARAKEAEVEVPDDLGEQVRAMIDGTERSWDDAVFDVARRARCG